MLREAVLQAALERVLQKDADHGEPENTFPLIASAWNWYLGGNLTDSLDPQDVAMMMALMKICRVMAGRQTLDSYVDLAGYAALAAELRDGASNG